MSRSVPCGHEVFERSQPRSSNAAGGLNPAVPPEPHGDNRPHQPSGSNPLSGKTTIASATVSGLSEPPKGNSSSLPRVALDKGFRWRSGVRRYAWPCLETRAEYRILKTIGADAIGHEHRAGSGARGSLRLSVLGLSVITDSACLTP